MVGIFFTSANGKALDEQISAMDKATQEWTMRAARGECAWVCADCCFTFHEGMPDACEHGHQGRTNIIKRDKAAARAQAKGS